MESRPLPEPLIDMIAQRFRVLSEPMRIKLLDQLREGPATVNELTLATRTSQQNASKHLGILHQAGLIRREKVGTAVRYEIADESVFALCDQVCGSVRAQLDALGEILDATSAPAPAGRP